MLDNNFRDEEAIAHTEEWRKLSSTGIQKGQVVICDPAKFLRHIEILERKGAEDAGLTGTEVAILEEMAKQQDRMAQYIASHDTLTQLADRLGCPREALTVENLAALVESARDVTNWMYGCCPDSDINALEATLAPFKRGA